MFGLLFDAIMIYALLYALLGGEPPSFGIAVLIALGVGLVNFGSFIALSKTIGLLCILPGAFVLCGLLVAFFGQTISRAAAATAGFLLYKSFMYWFMA